MAPPFHGYYDRFDWNDELDESEGSDDSDELDELGEPRHEEIRSHFPLDNLLYRTNRDPNNKPYLQNLRGVYFINRPPTYICGLYDEMDFFGCWELIDHLPSIESVNIDLLG